MGQANGTFVIECNDVVQTLICGRDTFLTHHPGTEERSEGRPNLRRISLREERLAPVIYAATGWVDFELRSYNALRQTETNPLIRQNVLLAALRGETIDGLPKFNVLGSPVIYSRDGSLIGRPNYLVYTDNDGFVPIFGIKLPDHKREILAQFYSYILNNAGYPSRGALSYSILRPPKFIDYKPKKKAAKSMADTVVKANNLIRNIVEEPVQAWTDACPGCERREVDCFTGMPNDRDLTLLHGIGIREQIALNNLGIHTINELAWVDLDTLVQKISWSSKLFLFMNEKKLRRLQIYAKAYEEGVTLIIEPIKLPPSRWQVYFDVESLTMYEGDCSYPFIFHHGAWVVDTTGKCASSYISHTARGLTPEYEKESLIYFWTEIANLTNSFSNTILIHYGTHDANATKSAFSRLINSDSDFRSIDPRAIINGLDLIRKTIISPWGHGLKTLSTRHGGAVWTTTLKGRPFNETYSLAGRTHALWLATNDDEYRQVIERYNRKDCEWLYWLMNHLHTGNNVRFLNTNYMLQK